VTLVVHTYSGAARAQYGVQATFYSLLNLAKQTVGTVKLVDGRVVIPPSLTKHLADVMVRDRYSTVDLTPADGVAYIKALPIAFQWHAMLSLLTWHKRKRRVPAVLPASDDHPGAGDQSPGT
jgi:hypothetical protein